MNLICIVEGNHERSVVVLDHFKNFKGNQLIVEYNIENEGIIIEGKGNYCLMLKKEKLKTAEKKVVKNDQLYQMNKSSQYNQHRKSEVEEICIYQNMESGRHSICSYI